MVTKNRRVAAYFPEYVDKKFKEFKEQTGINGDSEALIKIVMEHLGIEHAVSQTVSYLNFVDIVRRLEVLERSHFVTQPQLNELRAEVIDEIALAIEKSESVKIQDSQSPGESVGELPLISLISSSESQSRKVDKVIQSDIPSSLQEGLSARRLADRLQVDRKQLPKWSKEGRLSQETQERDPDNIAWMFDLTDTRFGKYHPIPPDWQ